MKSSFTNTGRALLLALLFASASAAANGSLLADAAKDQDWQAVQTLLAQKADVNLAQADGTTALAWAVYWDDLPTVQRLIEAGADASVGNDIGVTPLMLAIRNRNEDMVGALMKAGADANQAMWSGETPLMTAARTGLTGIAGLLLDHGADIDAREPRRGQNALMWAISFRHPDTARLLIERGADISAETTRLTEKQDYRPMILEGYAGNVVSVPQGGYTALMFAARAGDMESLQLLLDRGAEVNAVSAEDGPALVIASAWGHEDLALYLLNQGADPNIPDANGMTALHYAMRDGLKLLHGYEIVAATRVCGFAQDSRCKPIESITDQDREMMKDPAYGLYIVEGLVETENADREAAEILPGSNMYELAEALLARGADVNAEMKYPPPRLRLDSLPWLNLTGATPFMLASASLDYSGMEMLLEHGANPLTKTEVNHDVFQKQTKAYADDNQILGNGTPLMVAAGLGKKNDFTPQEERAAIAAVKRLVELGADVNEATATGWTPLHAAAFLGADNLIRFLVENGARVNVKNGCGRTPYSLAEGSSVAGLLDRTIPRQSTMKTLLSLGADESRAGKPVGECILGRGGLEVDIETRKEIDAIRAQQKAAEE